MQEQLNKRLETVRSTVWKMLDALALNGISLLQALKRIIPTQTMARPQSARHVDDRRISRRLRVDHDVSLWSEGMEPMRAHLINISRGGLYIETATPLDEGQVLKIRLPGIGGQQFPGITSGRVVRKAEYGMAIQLR